MPRGTLEYISESMKKNEYVCKSTAYICLNCLNIEPESERECLLAVSPGAVVWNKGMPISNTTLELESFLSRFRMTLGRTLGVG